MKTSRGTHPICGDNCDNTGVPSREKSYLLGRLRAALLLALPVIAMLMGTLNAQDVSPKDEIFGGYSWLFPNGWGDLDYKINNIPNAFDVSNTFYLPHHRNLGLVLDGSGHFRGGTTPPNQDNGSNDSTGVGYALVGLQYKFRRDRWSPFVRRTGPTRSASYKRWA